MPVFSNWITEEVFRSNIVLMYPVDTSGASKSGGLKPGAGVQKIFMKLNVFDDSYLDYINDQLATVS